MTQSSQCITCKHYLGNGQCAAFWPKTIPDKIFLGQIDHTEAVKGDNGIRFAPFESYAQKLQDLFGVRQDESETQRARHEDEAQIIKGGPASGNYAHKGRPGKHGGSVAGGGHKAIGLKGKPKSRHAK